MTFSSVHGGLTIQHIPTGWNHALAISLIYAVVVVSHEP